jgi:hypothetical protein
MAKQTKSRRRSMKQIADAMFSSKPPTGDVARQVQAASRARGATSPLGGTAVGGLFGPLAGLGREAAKKGAR